MTYLISKSGAVLNILLGAIAICVIFAAAYVTAPSMTASSGGTSFGTGGAGTSGVGGSGGKSQSRLIDAPLTTAELRDLLNASGLGAGELAAVGASADDTSTVAANAKTYVSTSTHLADLRSNAASVATLSAQVGSLVELAQRGQASDQDLTDLATARASLATSTSALATLTSGLVTAAVANLTSDQRTELAYMMASRGGGARDVPMAYKLTTRTDANWVLLRDSLSQEQFAAERSESVPAGAATMLSTCRGEGCTSAAITNLADANLAVIQTAWDTATTVP